jgi:hypothetical protein
MNFYNKFKKKFFYKDQDTIIVKNLIKELLPNQKVNYNFFQNSFKNYEDKFLNQYLYYILPLCLENIKIYNLNFPKILDIGCGFAPMCLAAKIFRSLWLNEKKIQNRELDYSYVGIDIRKDAIEYNKINYKKYPENYFLFHEASANVDYIGDYAKFSNNASNMHATSLISSGDETNYKIPFVYKADIQFSMSMFTHITPAALSNVVKFIYETLSDEGVTFNTCHIIDPESLFLMKSGLSDRYLGYDFGTFMSYSEKNPLLNTAYKIDYINETYKNSGLKIINIIKGNWRNIKKKGNGIDQDIIIAKKL